MCFVWFTGNEPPLHFFVAVKCWTRFVSLSLYFCVSLHLACSFSAGLHSFLSCPFIIIILPSLSFCLLFFFLHFIIQSLLECPSVELFPFILSFVAFPWLFFYFPFYIFFFYFISLHSFLLPFLYCICNTLFLFFLHYILSSYFLQLI